MWKFNKSNFIPGHWGSYYLYMDIDICKNQCVLILCTVFQFQLTDSNEFDLVRSFRKTGSFNQKSIGVRERILLKFHE